MRNVRADLRAMIPPRPGVAGALSGLLKLATYPRLWAVLLHRLATRCTAAGSTCSPTRCTPCNRP